MKLNGPGSSSSQRVLDDSLSVASRSDSSISSLSSVSFNYDVFGNSDAEDMRKPCVDNGVHLTEVNIGKDSKKYIPLFDGEVLKNVILGGGSGAVVALIINTHGKPVVRKCISVDQREAAFAQNLEAIGQASLLGKERAPRRNPRLASVLSESSAMIAEFVGLTRPEVTKRFVVTEGNCKKAVICGYDQTAFVNSCDETAPEFAKVIQNKGKPLTETQLGHLIKAQLDLVHLFAKKQSSIYLQRLSPIEGRKVFYNTYLKKFEARLGTEFSKSGLAGLPHTALSLDQANGLALEVQDLLLSDAVSVDGKLCINPLKYAHEVKSDFVSLKEGFLLHGDLQQTNAILVEGEELSLKCIDNRGADLQDYLADLTKILWGPKFVPIMENMLDVEVEVTRSINISVKPKAGHETAVENLHLFGNEFYRVINETLAYRQYLSDNPHASSQLLFTAGLQYLRDLGFILPRLNLAATSGDTETAVSLSRRVIADFAAAAEHMTDHLCMFPKE